jgi:hypothetical protein
VCLRLRRKPPAPDGLMIGLAAASRRETVNPLWPWIGTPTRHLVFDEFRQHPGHHYERTAATRDLVPRARCRCPRPAAPRARRGAGMDPHPTRDSGDRAEALSELIDIVLLARR